MRYRDFAWKAMASFAAASAIAAVVGLTPVHSATTQMPSGCDAPLALPPANFSQPLNIDFFKHELLYYRCSRYDADVAAVLGAAARWVERRRTQATNPAIVLDIDETSLSNWTRIFRDDFAYFPNGDCDLSKAGEACGDLAWQKSGLAPALQPTLDLFNRAKCRTETSPATCKTVAVFFVTGRYDEAKEWTEANLSKAGYQGWDGLYLRDPGTRGQPVSSHKIKARMDIERRGFTIIANIGDQDSDLSGDATGEHTERTFKIPNPFYFIP